MVITANDVFCYTSTQHYFVICCCAKYDYRTCHFFKDILNFVTFNRF